MFKKTTVNIILAAALYASGSGHDDHREDIALSLVVDTSYVNRNIDDAEASHLELPGLAHSIIGPSEEGGHGHSGYNARNGFNFNYAEIWLKYRPDHGLDFDGVLHISENSVEVETAYITAKLSDSLQMRGGKLYSQFGLHNSHHHHVWHFADAPLINEALFGLHGINDVGIQLQWNPFDRKKTLIGIELFQGDNETSFGYEAISYNGTEVAEPKRAPTLLVTYAKESFRLPDTDITTGISYIRGSTRIDRLQDEENPYADYGTTSVYGMDLSVEHTIDKEQSILWESEWLCREMDGSRFLVETSSAETLYKKQGGLYTQLIYSPDHAWSIGARYDTIYRNDVVIGSIDSKLPENLYRYSVMALYHIDENAKIRLQYNRNRALYDEDGRLKKVETVIFQFNYTIGSHQGHEH